MSRGAPNPGPGAAARNRAALVAAAREVFAESGIDAPLNAVARRAGVGQGSLYRHFPDRAALVAAVFEQNVDDLEARAQEAGLDLAGVLAVLTEQAIASVAMVDLVTRGPAYDERLHALHDRVAAVLAARLDDAQAAGRVPAATTVDDLLLGLLMVVGALGRTPPERRREVAARAWRLLGAQVDGGRDVGTGA
jgi:AcrR family transcriptional regulator